MSTRILTVSAISPYEDKNGKFVLIPIIRLQGKWLDTLGFQIGSKVKVYANGKTIIIKLLKD